MHACVQACVCARTRACMRVRAYGCKFPVGARLLLRCRPWCMFRAEAFTHDNRRKIDNANRAYPHTLRRLKGHVSTQEPTGGAERRWAWAIPRGSAAACAAAAPQSRRAPRRMRGRRRCVRAVRRIKATKRCCMRPCNRGVQACNMHPCKRATRAVQPCRHATCTVRRGRDAHLGCPALSPGPPLTGTVRRQALRAKTH